MINRYKFTDDYPQHISLYLFPFLSLPLSLNSEGGA
jgi:hypothetical protein